MMNIDLLLETPEIAAGWAKNSMTKQFFVYIAAEKEDVVRKMASCNDVNELLRLQGELRRMEKYIQLPRVLSEPLVLKQKVLL